MWQQCGKNNSEQQVSVSQRGTTNKTWRRNDKSVNSKQYVHKPSREKNIATTTNTLKLFSKILLLLANMGRMLFCVIKRQPYLCFTCRIGWKPQNCLIRTFCHLSRNIFTNFNPDIPSKNLTIPNLWISWKCHLTFANKTFRSLSITLLLQSEPPISYLTNQKVGGFQRTTNK